MATIATLAVQLSANTARFGKGMRRGQKHLQTFRQGVVKTTMRIVKFGSALTALAGGAGLTLMVKRSFETLDALAKVSDKLGITTEGLAQLRYAAKLTGVQANTLDMAIQRMTRRISEAAQDTGEAKDAIASLGLDAAKLAGMAPDKAFREIAEAMSHVKNQSDRVRLSFKLFDSEGVALVNTLGLGKKGLEEAAAAADRLGLSMTRMDLAKIEIANRKIDDLKALFTVAANTIAIQLAPWVDVLATRLVNAAVDGENFGRIGVKAMEWVTRSIVGTIEYIGKLSIEILHAQNTFGLFISKVTTWMSESRIAGPGLKRIGGLAEELKRDAEAVAEQIVAIGKTTDKMRLEVSEFFRNVIADAALAAKKIADEAAKLVGVKELMQEGQPAAAGAKAAVARSPAAIQRGSLADYRANVRRMRTEEGGGLKALNHKTGKMIVNTRNIWQEIQNLGRILQREREETPVYGF